ncbi:hypothetical protein [Methanogenium organophilum]|uniref:Uncharacterized protein n=1 Tax=Methanogenium organophilum TaxID=2199 RepID=A0A9X9T9I7_METOG|nr:hypothetical protein [Methanogenium organophilum]WAI02142.1 hypothetical protein OU421_04535 [Methanogenium organophilum]
MIPRRACDVVRWIFSAASYEVDDGDGAIDLSAFRDDECVVILCSEDTAQIEEFDRLKYRVSLENGPVLCKKLLISFTPPVQVQSCTVWNERELSEVVATTIGSYIRGDTVSLPLTPSAEAAAPHLAGRPYAEPEPEPEPGLEIPHLPVMITGSRAQAICGVKGTTTLRFIPYWAYQAESHGEKIYKTHIISFEREENGVVSAVNGLKGDFTAEITEMKAVPGDADILPPKLSKNDIKEKILSTLVEELSQTVRISQCEGDTIFYEDRDFSPNPENITISAEIIYVPVWQVRGNRIAEVNAFTGDILEMPMDDGVEVL